LIDVHSHMLLPEWMAAATAVGMPPPGGMMVAGLPAPSWSIEEHLAVMDEHGITASILSWPRATFFLRGKAARDLARSMNEALAKVVSAHPRRFGAFAVLPLEDLDATMEEMAYALDVLGLDGVSCSTNIEGVYLGDARFDDWFTEMNRRAVTLFIHPALPKGIDQIGTGLNAAILEFMFDSTRMATNMVLSGAKKRFCNIRMICTHAGGTVPFLASRIGILEPLFGAGLGRPVMTSKEVLEGLSTFYFDLTASTSEASLDALRHLVPASQLLAGYDFPMMPASTISPAMERLQRYPGFAEAERRMIRTENALGLFPRLASANWT
jgi:predicted TIM-barrel fold metal-dependent hydrolase